MAEDMEILIYNLIHKLKLGDLIDKPVRVMGGLLNRMYKVNTTSGIYAVKHLNPEVMKRENAKKNHILAEKIANIAKENNINCLPAKIINGTALQEIDGNYFFIFDWFQGKAVKENEITLEHIKKVSTLLAKLHNTNFDKVKNECNLGTENLEINWDFYISKVENKEIIDLLINNKEYLTKLDFLSTNARRKISNNLVVSHRDLDLPNILWDNNNNPMIIDWESSGVVNPCEELLETAWDWSGGQEYFDKEKFCFFINTYKENGGNLEDLDKAVYSNFKNKSGWLEYNLKRVCKLECIDEEEQKLGEREVIRVINEIIMFYNVIEVWLVNKKIDEIKSAQDVYNFITNNIEYGWIDINEKIHLNTMKEFRKLYRTMSIEEILKYKIGTCIDQVNLMHYLLNKINVKNKMFCCRIFEPDDYGNLEEEEHMHCFVLYYENNKVYHMEHPNFEKKGIYEYSSEEEAIKTIVDYYIKLRGGKESPTKEFYEIPARISFKEFNKYINHV